MYKPDQGALVISLDYEKYWGMRDKKSIDAYRQNLEGVDEAVKRTLSLFEQYNIRATWATVGFLFYHDFDALFSGLPGIKPAYSSTRLNPYHYIEELKQERVESNLHFAREGVDQVIATEGQELATHTFSHFYFLEEGIDRDSMKADLEAFIQQAKELGQPTHSIVFPRNQYNEDTLKLLSELKIGVYRGNETSWLYRPSKDEEQTPLRRMMRLADSMVNISGHHTGLPVRHDGLVNVPSSRFLRPVSSRFKLMNKLQTSRIKRSMTHAAKRNEVFHLWWHPHNFGANMDENFNRLEELLKHYQVLSEQYGFQSLNMQDFAQS